MKMTINPTDFGKPLWQKIHDQYLEQHLKDVAHAPNSGQVAFKQDCPV